MTRPSRVVAGLLLILIPTIQFGGTFLIRLNTVETAGFHDNPLRQNFLRAGHAHAGVLVILALVAMLYVDRAVLSSGVRTVVRWLFFAAPLFISGGFFGAVVHDPNVTRPAPLFNLVYVGAVLLAVAVVTLGVGMLRREPAGP